MSVLLGRVSKAHPYEIAGYGGGLMPRNIHDLLVTDIEYILVDAIIRRYIDITDDFDISVNIVRKVVRQHNHARLRRYK